MKKKRKTAGELSLKARGDSTIYDSLEVGHALTDDIMQQIKLCIESHYNKIDEPEFCVVMVLADDPLIKGVLRRKFYAWPYLPKPRPRQSVFLYRKSDDRLIRLWVLPDALTMATASEMVSVSPQWQTMKQWSDAFFAGKFFEFIRSQHGITLESESEYLQANREKLIKAGCQEVTSTVSDPFDFSKIAVNQVVNADTSFTE